MAVEQYALEAFVVGNGVHSDTLHDECNADTFAAKFLGATITYDAAGTVTIVDFMFSSALTGGERTDLDDLVAAHDGTPPPPPVDTRIPTQDENDALVGTGTPSTSNKYVTNDDARNTDARTPTAHDHGHASGYIDGLGIGLGATPDTDVDIATGKCRDGADSFDIVVGSILTAVNTASGADGLDTGAVAADTLYSIWVIADSTAVNPVASLLSLSATAPTIPSGYDKKRRVGWVITDGTSDNLNFQQVGNGRTRRIWYDTSSISGAMRVLTDGAATSFSDLDLSAYIPPTGPNSLLIGEFSSGAGGGGNDSLELRPNGFSASTANAPVTLGPGVISATKTSIPLEVGCPGQIIEYRVKNANNDANINVVGYDDEL